MEARLKGGNWRRILAMLWLFPTCALAQTPPAKLGLCAACHGERGHATLAGTPHLAGQDEQYLFDQLLAYREGRRDNAAMRAAVGSLQDRDLREIARWYASQDCSNHVGRQ